MQVTIHVWIRFHYTNSVIYYRNVIIMPALCSMYDFVLR